MEFSFVDDWESTPNFSKYVRSPYAAGLIGIGANPREIRITPDGKSHGYTFYTSPGELYLAEGLQ